MIAAAPPPPAPIACLERFYAGEARGEIFMLPNGTKLVYDDGEKNKSFADKLANPDIEDAFSIRYTTGAIEPVKIENHDPGRFRIDPLFAATYGNTKEKVDIVDLKFFGQTLPVNKKVKPAFVRVVAKLEKLVATHPEYAAYFENAGGTFVWRNIAGTNRRSAHSYGISIDLNVKRSAYWRWDKEPKWRNEIPAAVVDAFESEGFIWGGRWYHYDTMHFEYRPELLDPKCYPK